MVNREHLQNVLYEIIVKDHDLFMTTIPEGTDAEIMGAKREHPKYEPLFSHIVMIVHYIIQTFDGVDINSQMDRARIYDRLRKDRHILKTCMTILSKHKAKSHRNSEIDNYLESLKTFIETSI